MKKQTLSVLGIILTLAMIFCMMPAAFAAEDSVQEEVPAEVIHTHTPGEAVVENYIAPSCEIDGSQDLVVYCTECGEELSRESEEVWAMGHFVTVEMPKNPTCEEPGGSAYVYCSVCGTVLMDRVEIPATGHDYESFVLAYATCTEDGQIDYVCRNDKSHAYSVAIEKLGHYKDGGVVTEPTCQTEGYTTYTCLRCGENWVDDVVPPSGHLPGEPVIENEVEATCAQEGRIDKVIYCELCGEEVSRETERTEKLPHTTYVSKEAKEPTCTEEGNTEEISCSVCGQVIKAAKPIAKIDHVPYVSREAKEATCIEDGNTEEISCSVCGTVIQEYEPVGQGGHVPYVSREATEATCVTAGNTEEISCSVCGQILQEAEEIPAGGHKLYDAYVITFYEATCTKSGLYMAFECCEYCGRILCIRVETVPALGHDIVTETIITTTGKNGGYKYYEHSECTRCGAQWNSKVTHVKDCPEGPEFTPGNGNPNANKPGKGNGKGNKK